MSVDLEKYRRLDAFINGLLSDIYEEPKNDMAVDITKKMFPYFCKLTQLNSGRVLDVGCGNGFALDIMKSAGFNPVGIGFGKDLEKAALLGHETHVMDQSFLTFPDASFDAIWCRHSLEHSIAPLFTLNGFHKVLKPHGAIYIEVPAPDTISAHQNNKNHYSVFTKSCWLQLIMRSGFEILMASDIKFDLKIGPDIYYCFIARKTT